MRGRRRCARTPRTSGEHLRAEREGRGPLGEDHIRRVLSSHREASTVNSYANYFKAWEAYAQRCGLSVLPADPYEFAGWLETSSRLDKTAAPTVRRISAVAFFHDKAGAPKVQEHPVVDEMKQVVMRELGFRNEQKFGIYRSNLDDMYARFIAGGDGLLQNEIAYMSRALCYEATLRWSNLHCLKWQHILVTEHCVRLYITDAKVKAAPRWATIDAAREPQSAYQSLLRVLAAMCTEWNRATHAAHVKAWREVIGDAVEHTTSQAPTPVKSARKLARTDRWCDWCKRNL